MNEAELREALHLANQRIYELEEDNKTLRRGYQATGVEAWPCPGCHYEDGVFIEHCALHKEIELWRNHECKLSA